ncbi:uncharacterized protein LOC120340622 [Styela clava]
MSDENGLVTHIRNIVFFLIVFGAFLFIRYEDLSEKIYANSGTFLSKRWNNSPNFLRHVLPNSEDKKCSVQWGNDLINSTLYELKYFEKVSISNKNEKYYPMPLYPDPVFKMNPDKFILPLLQNGPNNQLMGFREAIFVGLKLNRTIVIPKFIKHHSDNQSTLPYVSPVHRIQVADLCKFISCISFDDFREACDYKIDAVFHIRKFSVRSIRRHEKFMDMKVREINKNNEGNDGPKYKFIPPTPIPDGRESRNFHDRDIIGLFDSMERCVIYPRPLFNLHLPPLGKKEYGKNLELVKNAEDLRRLSEKRLFLTIAHVAKNPKYITKLAEDFWRSTMKGRPYISLHWRYQKEEFMLRCNKPITNIVKKNICYNAMAITANDIAISIEQRVIWIRKAKLFNIRDIYIASPPSERNLIAEVAKILYEEHGWLTFTSLSLTDYLNDAFKPCPVLQGHYNDILSTTEMEICSLSVAFLGSQRSSWSDVVHTDRKAPKHDHISVQFDGDIFKMALKIIEERNETEKKKEQDETDSNHFVIEAQP